MSSTISGGTYECGQWDVTVSTKGGDSKHVSIRMPGTLETDQGGRYVRPSEWAYYSSAYLDKDTLQTAGADVNLDITHLLKGPQQVNLNHSPPYNPSSKACSELVNKLGMLGAPCTKGTISFPPSIFNDLSEPDHNKPRPIEVTYEFSQSTPSKSLSFASSDDSR